MDFRNLSELALLEKLPSAAMQTVLADARRFAAAGSVPVVLLGPTGAGKSLIARYVHRQSQRRLDPFHSHNLGALSDGTALSTLFGHRRGAFTGAVEDSSGAVAAAGRGTLFLDELTRCPPPVQAMLLQLLDTGEFRRVGDTHLRQMECRVVTAMNEEPEVAIQRGAVLDDLYARLEGLDLRVPPLRERVDDIPVLAMWFVSEFDVLATTERRERRLHRDLQDALCGFEWPHNVRQLRGVMRRVVLNAEGATELTPRHLRGTVLDGNPRAPKLSELSLPALEDFVRAHGRSKSAAAEALGCHRSSLHRRLDRLRREKH